MIQFEDPCDLTPSVLRFIYGGDVNLTIDTVTAMLALARGLLVPDLENVCIAYIRKYGAIYHTALP